MTIPATSLSGYSAAVELTLMLADQRVPLAAVGPDHVTACEAVELAPGKGILTLLIDGSCSSFQIELPLGSVPYDRQIPIRVLRPDGCEPSPLQPLPLQNDTEWYRFLEEPSTHPSETL